MSWMNDLIAALIAVLDPVVPATALRDRSGVLVRTRNGSHILVQRSS